MALAASGLSLAAEGIATLVQAHFANEIVARVDTPAGAQEAARGAGNTDKDFVNLFFYRVAPGGFRPELSVGDPLWLRLFCLVTPFPKRPDQAADDQHPELTILGDMVRLLSSRPVLPVRAAPPPGVGETPYRLDAILLAPNMEEVNHIWTTQGSDVPYRLSAVFEFSLVPIEPLEVRVPGPPVALAQLQVEPDAVFGAGPAGGWDVGLRAVPPTAAPGGFVPLLLLQAADGGLVTERTVHPSTTSVRVALVGPVGRRAFLERAFFDAGGLPVAGGGGEAADIVAGSLESSASRFYLTLDRPNGARRMTLTARAAQADGTVVPGAPAGSALTVSFVP